MSRNKMKLGILVYKTGKSFTKGESRLQNRNPIYKKGTLRYKRDSRLTIYQMYVFYNGIILRSWNFV